MWILQIPFSLVAWNLWHVRERVHYGCKLPLIYWVKRRWYLKNYAISLLDDLELFQTDHAYLIKRKPTEYFKKVTILIFKGDLFLDWHFDLQIYFYWNNISNTLRCSTQNFWIIQALDFWKWMTFIAVSCSEMSKYLIEIWFFQILKWTHFLQWIVSAKQIIFRITNPPVECSQQ